MQLGIPYAKTALGRTYLEQAPTPGSRAQRSLLIMMDGRKTVRNLMPAIKSLGMKISDVQALVSQGLLEPVQPPAPVTHAEPDLAPPPRQVVESKSLVVAKLFAQDLLVRMLDAQDTDWLDKARAIHSPRALLRWIVDCSKHLANVVGTERAERFRAQTLAFVPDHHLKAHGPGHFSDLLPERREENTWQHTRPFTRSVEPPRRESAWW